MKHKSKSNNKSNSNSHKKPKKRVVWKSQKFVDMVDVESYRKYNVDMSYNEPEQQETTRCRCLIF